MTRDRAIALSARQTKHSKQCHNQIRTLTSLVHRILRLEMPHIQDPQLLRDIKRGMKAAGIPVPPKVQVMRSNARSPSSATRSPV